jgi:D-methionine transport system substrate-binding protein
MILALHGVIKLRNPNDVGSTVADITDNPKKLRFVELDAAQLPRSLQDVDLASINNNYAVQAGLNPATDAIAREATEGPWVNILAVREEDKDKPWVQQLIDAYHSEPVREFVLTRFKGTYLPAW